MRVLLRDLTPGTNYIIQLRSISDGSVSEWSRVFPITTVSDTVAPKTPTTFTGSMAGTSFKYSWDAVTLSADESSAWDLTHYEVTITSSGSGATATFITKDTKFELSLEQNVTVFTTPQANVQASVKAVDQAGNKSAATSTVSLTNVAPAQPANFVAQALQDSVSLQWDAVADLDVQDYRVYSGTTAGFTPSGANIVYRGKVTSCVHFNIAYSIDTFYKLAAVDVFNTESTYAASGAIRPISPFVADATPPAVPTGLAAVLTTDIATLLTSAAVSWTAVTDTSNDLASYIIGYRPVGAADWQYSTVDYTNITTTIDRLTPYVNYEFRIRSSDWAANLSAWSATVTTTTTAVDIAPSQPSVPTASSSTLQVQVTQPFTKEIGGALEADVTSFNVYASTTTGFTPTDTEKVGQIIVGPTNVGTFYLPATGGAATQTWYIKTIAVDRGGNISPASTQATATPGLIAATNIIDATITSAKIFDLVADKITAGSGIIANLDVKSTLTLGTATTTGVIQSYGYVAGTTGFSLSKDLLEINQGSIAAAALKIQQGKNLIPVQYAGFEFASGSYATAFPAGGFTKTISASGAKYGTQCLQLRAPSAAANEIYLGSSVTDYNINVEEGKTYIISAWVKGGTVTSDFSFRAKYSDATPSALFGTTSITAAAPYARQSATLLIPAGVTAMVLRLDCATATTDAGWDVDGIQVEEQWGAITSPSVWTPPSSTHVDGGYIRTGEIRSTSTINVNGVEQPYWLINMNGNAQFGSVSVRGSLIVGAAGADVDAGQSYVASGNFSLGLSGWKIDSAGDVEFNSGIFRGTLGAGTLDAMTITGALIRTAASGRRIEQDAQGFRMYDGSGGILINLPTTEGLNPTFVGQITASGLTVLGNSSMQGASNELASEAVLTMASKVTLAKTAPMVFLSHDVHPFPNAWPSTYSGFNGGEYESGHFYIPYRQSGTDGVILIDMLDDPDSVPGAKHGMVLTRQGGSGALAVDRVVGLVVLGSYFYSAVLNASNNLVINKFNFSDGAWVSLVVEDSSATITAAINLGVLGKTATELLYGGYLSETLPGLTTLTVYKYTTAGTLNATYTAAESGIDYNVGFIGYQNFDYGAPRMVVSTSTAGAYARPYTLSGSTLTIQSNELFWTGTPASGGYSMAMVYDGTRFKNVHSAYAGWNVLTLNKWTTESSTWWASTAYICKTMKIDLGAATAGTVTITFAGQTTTSLAYNASNATIQAAMEALSNVDVGDVFATGGPWPSTPVHLDWRGDNYSLTIPAIITATPTGLTGGTVTITPTALFESMQSPKQSFIMAKRMQVDTYQPSFPTTSEFFIDSTRNFLGRGSTEPARTEMWNPMKTGANGYDVHADPVLFSGTSINNPSSVEGFPFTTPAAIQSSALRIDGTPLVSIAGDGSTNGLVPTGTVIMFAATTLPTGGWLSCNGASLATTNYPDLFAVIGYTYGGSGANFTLPNFASKFPMGNTPGATGGTDTHNHTLSGVTAEHVHYEGPHSHTLSDAGHARIGIQATGAPNFFMRRVNTAGWTTTHKNGWAGGATGDSQSLTYGASLGGSTDSTDEGYTGNSTAPSVAGASDSEILLPPYQGVNFIIKT